MASTLHTARPDADHRRRAALCWAETRRARPALFARAWAALSPAERARIARELETEEEAPR